MTASRMMKLITIAASAAIVISDTPCVAVRARAARRAASDRAGTPFSPRCRVSCTVARYSVNCAVVDVSCEAESVLFYHLLQRL